MSIAICGQSSRKTWRPDDWSSATKWPRPSEQRCDAAPERERRRPARFVRAAARSRLAVPYGREAPEGLILTAAMSQGKENLSQHSPRPWREGRRGPLDNPRIGPARKTLRGRRRGRSRICWMSRLVPGERLVKRSIRRRRLARTPVPQINHEPESHLQCIRAIIVVADPEVGHLANAGELCGQQLLELVRLNGKALGLKVADMLDLMGWRRGRCQWWPAGT